MRVDDRRWRALVDSFNAAAVSSGTWLAALTSLAEATGSQSGQLIGFGSPNAVLFNWMTGVGPNWAEDFIAHGGTDPHRDPYVTTGTTLPVLRTITSAEIADERTLNRNELLQWHEREYGSSRICLTPLVKQNGFLVAMAVMRSRKQGEISSEERAIFTTLAPHVRTAVLTQIALEHQGAFLVPEAMEALSLAVFVCDAAGTVRAMTPEAEAFVRECGALRLQNGKLSATIPAESHCLSQSIAAAARGLVKLGARAASTVIVRGHLMQPLPLEIVPLPAREHAFRFEPRALVIAGRCKPSPDRVKAVLTKAYQLTSTEAEIALQLAEGVAPETIADKRNVKAATIRVQIRAIYAKLDVHRLSELAAKLQSLR